MTWQFWEGPGETGSPIWHFLLSGSTSLLKKSPLKAICHCSCSARADNATDFSLVKNLSRGHAKKVKCSSTSKRVRAHKNRQKTLRLDTYSKSWNTFAPPARAKRLKITSSNMALVSWHSSLVTSVCAWHSVGWSSTHLCITVTSVWETKSSDDGCIWLCISIIVKTVVSCIPCCFWCNIGCDLAPSLTKSHDECTCLWLAKEWS